MDVLAISIARGILEAGSRERERACRYAEALGAYHVILLTRRTHHKKTEVHEQNLHLYPTHSSGRLMMLVDAIRIARRIPLGAPSVVTAQDPFVIGFISWLISLIKKMDFHVQCHGDYFSSPFWHEHSWFRPFERLLARFVLRRARGIRVVSERIKRSLVAHGIPNEKIIVLPIRPELERFLAITRPTASPTHPLQFLMMSRLSVEKNIPLAIRAFGVLHATHQHTRLIIAGRGSLEQPLQALIASLNLEDAVFLLPWTNKPESLYSLADVFLLSSDHEAYGLTLVEAMAAGLPIVTTDVGCVGEVVQDGTHGIVVPPRDERAFADALRYMVAHPEFRFACGRHGRATASVLARVGEREYVEAWVAALSGRLKEV